MAAIASYLEARQHNGRWLLRIENIDPPREQPGAARQIVDALESYGFEWDGPVFFQADSHEQHAEALEALLAQELAYRCVCSRRDLADAKRSPLGKIYPGTCSQRGLSAGPGQAIRVRTSAARIRFADLLQGAQKQDLESESGDFVILRKDKLIAYHLAVVVDDHLQQVSHIVRGIDLLESTPRQIWLQQLLGYSTPSYAHIPVAVHRDGSKLSKLTGALGLPMTAKEQVLLHGLRALGQQPPPDLQQESLAAIWRWALDHWRIDKVTGQKSVPGPAHAIKSGTK